MSNEIDDFIQQQKAKLARERGINKSENLFETEKTPQRKHWKRDASTILQEYANQYAPEKGFLSRGGIDPQKIEPLAFDRPITPDDGGTLQVGNAMADYRSRLANERKQEYREFLNTHQSPPKRRPETPQETGLPLGNYEERRSELNKQRKREYNDMLQKNQNSPKHKQSSTESSPALKAVIDTHASERKRYAEDRIKEYNEELQEKNGRSHKENIPPVRTNKPDTPEMGLIGKLGSYEERRKRLQDERKREYNEMIAGRKQVVPPLWLKEGQSVPDQNKVRTRGIVTPEAANYANTIPGLKDNTPAQRSPQPRRPPPSGGRDRRIPDNSPPPSRSRKQRDYDSRSEKPRRLEDTVHDEDAIYEHFMRERLREAPRRGWATPTYEEILDKKRHEERAYRRGGYDEDVARALGSETYAKNSRNDGHLNRYITDELKKFKQLDQEYEAKKVRFRDDRSRGSQYDPSSLDPNAEFDRWDNNKSNLDRIDRDLSHMRRDLAPPRKRDEPTPRRGNFEGSLAVGRDVSASTDQKRKAAYRNELQQQMQQAQNNKKREKEEGLHVNATGLRGIFQSGANEPAPRKQTVIKEDTFRDLYKTPSDDAYLYYGKVNPLDPNPVQEGVSFQDQLNDSSYLESGRGAAPLRPSIRINKVAGPYTGELLAFGADDDRNRNKEDAKKNYQQELKRQIEQDKQKKVQSKREQDAYDLRLDEEIRNYNPYGKGGGGAPMRDTDGNVLADLRKMNIENSENLLSPGRKAPSVAYNPSINFQSPRKSPDPFIAPISTRSANTDDQNFARGGNGIFGEPMGDVQKRQRERYQDELKAQIEEKKRYADEEKRKLKEEEERLLQRIEEDNKRMQEDFEKEQAKTQAKHEAALKVQQELARQQEEKKNEVERRRKEAEQHKLDEIRRIEDEKRREREGEERPLHSPPVPALRSKTEDPQPVTGRRSPPVPAQRSQSRTSRAQSADVLNQLAKLKQQLQSESKRVETDLRSEQKEPEVYDPRLYQRPEPSAYQHVDVFDVGSTSHRSQQPPSVRRNTDDSTDPNSLNEFRKLKKGSTASRQQLHKMFPDAPTSGDALEAQQRALLLAQEDQLNKMKGGRNKSPFEKRMPDMTPKGLGLLREPSSASAHLLDSDSAFIDVPANGFASDFDNLSSRRRNDSARSRRRRTETPSYRAPSERSYDPRSNMGSQISLDPDRIDRRNEERLRKLKSLTADEQSLADPDDILERFMAKQHHARPPSGHTLQDDSWLRPTGHNR